MSNSFTGKIEVSMDGLRKDLSGRASCLKDSLLDFLREEDIAIIDAEDVIEELNGLICSVNMIQCISLDGIDGFSNQPDVYVKLVDMDN